MLNNGRKKEDFEELLQRNRGRLNAISRSYGGQQADDLMQEILLQIWRSLESFENRASIDTWSYRIALNTAISWCRSASRRNRKLPQTSADVEAVSGAADGPDACELLEQFLATLNDSDRAVVLMYLEDMTAAQMADILGTSEGALRVRLHRIKTRLANWQRGES